jgi:poly-beta-hydroxyalkanoate depolymerase
MIQNIVSFTVDQAEQYKEFFDKYGFVVVRDIIPKEDLLKTIDEIWHEAETTKDSLADIPTVDRYDPTTWTSKHG